VQLLDFHGLGLRVVVYFEDEPALERKIELIKAICGYNGDVARWISVLPHCGMRLLDVDWKILKAVMHDPRRDSSEVAEETGVSKRTINRRLRRMTETNVAYLIPVRNVKMSKGNICSFLIFCSGKGRVSIREFLGSQPLRVDFIHNSARDVFIVTLVTDNLSEANEMREKLKALEEVREVRMGVLNDFVFIDDWLDHAVERQIVS
jgi:DNA-binding Lrp family transcriptional regulator